MIKIDKRFKWLLNAIVRYYPGEPVKVLWGNRYKNAIIVRACGDARQTNFFDVRLEDGTILPAVSRQRLRKTENL